MPPWVPRRKVDSRYGWSGRTTWRAAAEGRIPAPEYPVGPNRPLWDLEKLEANERAAVKGPPDRGDAA
jgi:hypothetical protein